MKSVFPIALLLVLVTGFSSCSESTPHQAESPERYIDSIAIARDVPLDLIQLPPGFNIMLYAWDIENARGMAISSGGILYVGSRSAGRVYALQDTDNDYRIDETYILAEDLNSPNGVALHNGDLYIAEISRILVIRDIDNQLANDMSYEVIYDALPTDKHHGWKYITFGPDNKLYVPIGAPCNICDEGDPYASITRMDPDGSNFEIVQRGIRNSVGITFHPITDELWFTDNGRDWLGDDQPYCELNRAPEDGLHFGYPYCHHGELLDPEFGSGKDCADYRAPAQSLGPHVAPLGLEFYTGDQFPEEYNNDIFIAEHGSWNRSTPIGYRIMQVPIENDTLANGYETFADGWLNSNGSPWGRPVDIELLPDGSMLVSDDFAGNIFRIWYAGK